MTARTIASPSPAATSRSPFAALRIAFIAFAIIAAAGCQDEAARAAEQAKAQAAAAEAEAQQFATGFDKAFAEGNWQMAKAQGDVLLARYPQTEAAKRIGTQHAEAATKANAAREDARVAALWAYQSQAAEGGQQLSAAIYAKDRVDVDGSGAKPVRLIFRDHPSWGRSSYLVLEAGDFKCRPNCRVSVKTDDGEPQCMAANRPDTDEAIAMFIDDQKALWKKTDGATLLSIEFPVAAGGTRTAVFEVSGLDRAKLPGWD